MLFVRIIVMLGRNVRLLGSLVNERWGYEGWNEVK